MAKTKLEKITSIEEEIRRLNVQKAQLKQQHNQQERKERNHRLCKRGGLVEKLLPGLITLTDEQFESFVHKTLLTSHTKRILAEMATQAAAADNPQRGAGTAQNGAAPTASNAIPSGGA